MKKMGSMEDHLKNYKNVQPEPQVMIQLPEPVSQRSN